MGHGSVYRPSRQTRFERRLGDVKTKSPALDRQSLPTPFDVARSPLVERLLGLCRPSTVTRLVISVVVVSLNRVSRWAFTHVTEEGGVIIEPAVTHRDASPAVMGKMCSSRVHAARLHIAPNLIGAGRAVPMRPVCCPGTRGNHAPTAGAASASEIAGLHDPLSAAIASTEPCWTAPTRPSN